MTLCRLVTSSTVGRQPGDRGGAVVGGRDEEDCVMVFRVLGISGTIRKAEERLIRRDQLDLFLCDDR